MHRYADGSHIKRINISEAAAFSRYVDGKIQFYTTIYAQVLVPNWIIHFNTHFLYSSSPILLSFVIEWVLRFYCRCCCFYFVVVEVAAAVVVECSRLFCILSFSLIERSSTVSTNLFVGIRRNDLLLCYTAAVRWLSGIHICGSPPLYRLCSIYNIRQISLAALVLLLCDSKYGTAFVYKTIKHWDILFTHIIFLLNRFFSSSPLYLSRCVLHCIK